VSATGIGCFACRHFIIEPDVHLIHLGGGVVGTDLALACGVMCLPVRNHYRWSGSGARLGLFSC
jgi:hypothetical protein